MIKLYDYFRSSACFRVRIALNLKKLDYQCEPIHLINHGGEQHLEGYRAINPQSLVPSLKDGDVVITQSLAIMEYLEERFPEPCLLPGTTYQKALIRAFALAIAADTHPLNNLRVLNFLTDELMITSQQKQHWYEHWVARTFTALERQLTQKNHQSHFCFGDTPTFADICLVPQMFNARRFNCDVTPYPTLIAIDENCQQHEAFYKAFPTEVAA